MPPPDNDRARPPVRETGPEGGRETASRVAQHTDCRADRRVWWAAS